MRFALPFVMAFTLAAACADIPALDGTIAPADRNAPFPALVPLAPLMAQGEAAGRAAGATAQAQITPRLSGLRARAANLRGPVIAPAARARMLRTIR